VGPVAAAVATAGNRRLLNQFWTAYGPVRVAYGLIALAVIFFFLGLAGCPFPLGDGFKQREKHLDSKFRYDHEPFNPINFGQ